MIEAVPDRVAELQDLERQLRNLRSRSDLTSLCTWLNFEPAGNQPLVVADPDLRPQFAEVSVVARAGEFHIIYGRMSGDKLSKTAERLLINDLLVDHPDSLFVFSDQSCQHWHFVNHRRDISGQANRQVLRRITVAPNLQLRTATDRLLRVMVASVDKQNALRVTKCVNDAFDVEAVTLEFFRSYQQVFRGLQTYLNSQVSDPEWAHDYALQFLNRLMFIYFIQRRPEQWLGPHSYDFLFYLWQQYRKAGREVNSFYQEWLSLLFFDSFARKPGFHPRLYLPTDLNDALQRAPYLNGGLFSPDNALDTDHAGDFVISDRQIETILSFFQRYNFTISEDTPFDQEVAVDPEMIGKVYESLVNLSEQSNERGDAGIFYTPRTEIELMCRLTLVDYFGNRLPLGGDHKPLLYDFIFAADQREKDAVDERISELGLWEELDKLIGAVKILDPACGSGAFLIGMLNILYDLYLRANKYVPRFTPDKRPYRIKKRIIGENIYGVDVMQWAVDVAELRLWLQLILDTEFQPEELQIEPLLPNLSFKVRPGDSLVQEVGGLNLGLRHSSVAISPTLKGKLTILKSEKLKFYNNEQPRRFRTLRELQQEEINIFRDILSDRSIMLGKQIEEKHQAISQQQAAIQTAMFGENKGGNPAQIKQLQDEVKRIEDERKEVIISLRAMTDLRGLPFVWDVAFVEVFEERKGFDIVVGNPPYVRQEMITDPRAKRDRRNLVEVKRFYKDKLMRSVYARYPDYFGFDPVKGKAARGLDAKSDLYLYFYFHALSLLNPQGSFAFITSNSWLDVGYGAELQEFLLKQTRIKFVLDNQVQRSFANADVNTVIVLTSAPSQRAVDVGDNLARFVLFRVPFDHVAQPALTFQTLEATDQRTTADQYRIYPLRQRDLLQSGTAVETEGEDEPVKPTRGRPKLATQPRYVGDKWGGKYLRAPDIYFKLLEAGRGKLVPLGSIADVRFGIKTGANEFFYLEDITQQADDSLLKRHGISRRDTERLRLCRNSSGFEAVIEAEYLKPVLKSPREVRSIIVDPAQLRWQVLLCPTSRADLKGSHVLDYIEWGEAERFDERPSTANRPRWWDLGIRKPATINCNYLVDKMMRFYYCPEGVYVSDNFQEIHTSKENEAAIMLSMNSLIQALWINMLGRTNFGGGLLKVQTYEVAQVPCLRPELLPEARYQLQEFIRLGISDDFNSEGRIELDGTVLGALDMIFSDHAELQGEVEELINRRLMRAHSV